MLPPLPDGEQEEGEDPSGNEQARIREVSTERFVQTTSLAEPIEQLRLRPELLTAKHTLQVTLLTTTDTVAARMNQDGTAQ